MTLSIKTINELSNALKAEIIDYIHKDERYVLFMQEVIRDAILEKLGPIDDDVLFELSYCVMGKMCLR